MTRNADLSAQTKVSGSIRNPQPIVSIIVPCRNEVKHLRGFLDSVFQQDLAGCDWEVIVADGMSDDGTWPLLEEYARKQPRLRLLRNPAGIVSTGLNACIRAARGDIIVRMDAHTEYAPNYVKECLRALNETGADNVGGPPRARTGNLRMRAMSAAYHSRFAVGASKSHDVTYEGYVDSVFYGCWKKKTLERVGLFDETLVRNQDDELNLRLTRSGGKVWQTPKIVSYYHPRSELGKLCRQYFQYGFWKVAVIRRHRLPASWRHLVPGAFVAALGISFLSWLISEGGGHLGLAAVSKSLLSILLLSYAGCCVIAAFTSARSHGWSIFPILPAIFAAYHLSYGLGFLCGLAWALLPGSRLSRPARAFVELSR
jgi:succinoglycan biosynthesis protein ExoA